MCAVSQFACVTPTSALSAETSVIQLPIN
jgi:hypothetical protein